jgi:DNA-binding transcriptional ArsR family regulator
MAKTASIFAALSDPTRRAILDSLRGGGGTAGHIAGQFRISWPAISRHLRILKAAGLVWETRDGRSRYYEINQQALFPAVNWLDQFRGPARATTAPAPSSAGREYSS